MFNRRSKYEFGGEITEDSPASEREHEVDPRDPWIGGYQGWQQSVPLPPGAQSEQRPSLVGAAANNLVAPLQFSRGRNDSVDFGGLDSVPHTPENQLPPQSGGFSTMHRFTSVSSINTTDDEDANYSDQIWTDAQEQIVREAYDEIVSDPTTTPFSGRFPPSGIIQRVAKLTLRKAKTQRVDYMHSVNATRHKILVLFSQDERLDDEFVSRAFASESAQDQGFNDDDDGMVYNERVGGAGRGMFVSNEPTIESSLRHPISQAQQQQPLPFQHPKEADEFHFDTGDETSQTSITSKYGEATTSGGPGVLPADYSRGQGLPLASPFKETPPELPSSTRGDDQMETESDFVNIVAKRKRDSLRMKRGVR